MHVINCETNISWSERDHLMRSTLTKFRCGGILKAPIIHDRMGSLNSTL